MKKSTLYILPLILLSGCQEGPETVGAAIDRFACPENFSLVTKNYALGTKDFCLSKDLMAYDEKLKLVVRQNFLRAVIESAPKARQLCQALGPRYDLISIAEYQAAAREVEQINENWSGGAVASGSLGKDSTYSKLLSGDTVDGAGNTLRRGGVDAYSTWTKDNLSSYTTAGHNLDLKAADINRLGAPVVAVNALYDDVMKWFAPKNDYSLIPDALTGDAGLGSILLQTGFGYVTRGPLTGATFQAEFALYSSAAWIGFHCVYNLEID